MARGIYLKRLRRLAQAWQTAPMTTTTDAHYEDLEPTIGDRLRIARERRTGLDQKAFADLINVSRGTVSNYERGNLPGGPRQTLVLNSWASKCEVSREWLETGHVPTGDDGPGNPEPSDYSCVVYELPKVA